MTMIIKAGGQIASKGLPQLGNAAKKGSQLLLGAGGAPKQLLLESGLPKHMPKAALPKAPKLGLSAVPQCLRLNALGTKGLGSISSKLAQQTTVHMRSTLNVASIKKGAAGAILAGTAMKVTADVLTAPFSLLNAAVSAPNSEQPEVQAHLRSTAQDALQTIEDQFKTAAKTVQLQQANTDDATEDSQELALLEDILQYFGDNAEQTKLALGNPNVPLKDTLENFAPLTMTKQIVSEKFSPKAMITAIASATTKNKLSGEVGIEEKSVPAIFIKAAVNSAGMKAMTGNAMLGATLVFETLNTIGDAMTSQMDQSQVQNTALDMLLNQTGFNPSLDQKGQLSMNSNIIIKP